MGIWSEVERTGMRGSEMKEINISPAADVALDDLDSLNTRLVNRCGYKLVIDDKTLQLFLPKKLKWKDTCIVIGTQTYLSLCAKILPMLAAIACLWYRQLVA